MHFEIPGGYFGKIYPKSGLLANHFVSFDIGVIDSGYHGVVLVLMKNRSKEEFFVKKGYRITQLVIHKKENVIFKRIYTRSLESTEREGNGFDSSFF